MAISTEVVEVRYVALGVEQRHAPLLGAMEGETSAQFDMSDARTVVGPGENCLVCDEPLVAGEVFVPGTWDGRLGPAHEDCPLILGELLADSRKEENDGQASHESGPRGRGGRAR